MIFWGDTIQSPHYYKNIWCIENENGWALVFMRVYYNPIMSLISHYVTHFPLCHSFPVSYRIVCLQRCRCIYKSITQYFV